MMTISFHSINFLKLRVDLFFILQFISALTSLSHAQSSVSLGGQIDTAIRYSTNNSPSGDSKIALGAAPDGFGTLRITGADDLGGDMSAHFKLESQFLSNNGAQVSSPANSLYGLFGRESSVGIKAGNHTVDAGRLQGTGTAAEPLVAGDPVNGRGFYTETIWPGVYCGLRFSNAVRYRYVENGIKVGVMHSFGGQTGSIGESSMTAGTLGYSADNVTSVMAYQVVNDSKNNTGKTFSLGGFYNYAAWTLSAAYINSKEEKGFAGIPTTGIISPLPPLLSAQTMNFYLAGLTYRATQMITLKTAYYSGRSDGGTFVPSTRNGNIATWYGVGEYALSKQTKFVAGADFNNWTGGYAGYWGSSAEQQKGLIFTNGKNTRTTISIGIEHLF